MRKGWMFTVLAAGILFAALSTETAWSQAAGVNEPWTFAYPGDGDTCYGTVPFFGSGDSDEIGTLMVFSYNDTIPGGIYPSELSLELSVTVSTYSSSTWSYTTLVPEGTWFAAVFSADFGSGQNLPFPTGDPADPENDVNNLLAAIGGDGVVFTLQENVDP